MKSIMTFVSALPTAASAWCLKDFAELAVDGSGGGWT